MSAKPSSKRKIPTALDYLPGWTQRVVLEATGRDPLGLASVSGIITDHLLLGITTQTERARYYSFYPWSLWHIQKSQPPKRFGDFQEQFQRREAAFAVASILDGSKDYPVGVDAAYKRLDHGRAEGEVNTAFQVLPSNPLGGYGQYYQGSLKKLGLVTTTEHADLTLEGMGSRLAEAFEASVANTPYIRKGLFNQVRASIEDLEKSSDVFSVNSIRSAAGKQERALLKELLFELTETSDSSRPNNRRWTLVQILHLLGLYEKYGINIAGADLDDILVYWPHYYGLLFEPKNKPLRYQSPAACTSVHARWRQFVLHQFTTLALECLLRAILDTLALHREGLRWEELMKELLSAEFYKVLKNRAGKACPRPRQLLEQIGVTGIPDEQSSLALQASLIPGHVYSEIAWLDDEDSSPAGWLLCGVGLLAVLYGKWRGIHSDPALNDLAKATGNELWFGALSRALDQWFDENLGWEAALSDFLSQFILERHDQVMYQKGRLDACWINRTGNVFMKEQDLEPDVHSSRHHNALTILQDLCLLERTKEAIRVTPEGRKLAITLLKEDPA